MSKTTRRKRRWVVCVVPGMGCEDVCGAFRTEKSIKFDSGKDVVTGEGVIVSLVLGFSKTMI